MLVRCRCECCRHWYNEAYYDLPCEILLNDEILNVIYDEIDVLIYVILRDEILNVILVGVTHRFVWTPQLENVSCDFCLLIFP